MTSPNYFYKGTNMTDFKLELTEDHLHVIQESLDLYMRTLLGQFEEVAYKANLYNVNKLNGGKPDKHQFDKHSEFEDEIHKLKGILGFSPHESYGIFNENIHDNARVAYDIKQVIRNYLANYHYKEGDSRITVAFDEPMRTSKIKLPEIK